MSPDHPTQDPIIEGVHTLVDLVRRRAAAHGERLAYTFLENGEDEAGHLTYAELDTRAQAIAARLQAEGLAGQRALMLYPPGLDFVTAFLGCLYAGVVAVPAYPPASKRHLPRLRSIVVDAQPAIILTVGAQVTRIRRAAETLGEIDGLPWRTTDTIYDSHAEGWSEPTIGGETLAFLQYTSGSTAAPKGVMVTHGNLLHNEAVIQQGFGLGPDDLIVGWLPLYHDMGLIGNLLQPLWLGTRCVFMAPVAFLQKPLRWLAAISKYRGTTSGGPNFAYELCAQRVSEEQRRELDLSSWKLAFSGAEPIRASTLDTFASVFAPQGFHPEAFYPCYGMAETTLMSTGGDRATAPVVRTVDAAELEQDRVVDAEPGGADDEGKIHRLVGCGKAGRGLEVAVVDPTTRRRLDDRRVGEIWVAGGSVATGYWQRDEATAETFGARLADDSDPGDGGQGADARSWLRTGDLGFLDQGELFVTGRLKDLIIIRGRNHYPQDIELTAQRSHPSLRPDSGAAFSVDVAGEERLVIVHEIERRPSDEPEVLLDAIRRSVAEQHEVRVYEVVLIRVGTLPKTSSGKIQRQKCRREYLDGELTVMGRDALDEHEAEELMGAELTMSREALLAVADDERRPLLDAFLADRLARLARVPRSTLGAEVPLTQLGLDSLTAVELKNGVEEHVGVDVALAALLEGQTLGELADDILEQLVQGRREGAIAPPVPTDGQTEHPLSHGQLALWYLHRLDPDSSAYNIAGAARVRAAGDGPVFDPGALERAATDLAHRHPALRTTFHPQGTAEPLARVHESLPPEIAVIDAKGWSDDTIRQRLASEAHRPFDLEKGPLFRLVVLRRGEAADAARVVLAVHHIVADFWSLGLILRDLGALYGRHRSGAPAELEPLPLTPADFSRWQNQLVAGPVGEQHWSYWRETLAGELPLLDLPTDRPRPAIQTFRGAAVTHDFAPDLGETLQGLARRHGATLFMLLLAGWQALLHRLSQQDEILVGSPATLRGHAGLADMVGYLVNPLVLRGAPGQAERFADLLAESRERVLGALAHADLPFPQLVERLAPDHDASRSPLFQNLFVLQKDRPSEAGLAGFALGREGTRLELGGLALESLALPHDSAQFDLSLVMAEADGRLGARLEYNRDLFDPTTAERLLGYLDTLLGGIARGGDTPLPRLPLLGESERRQLVVERNQHPLDDGEDGNDEHRLTLHGLVARQARRTPAKVALWHGGDKGGDEGGSPRQITYAQLIHAAGRLARHLKSLGVGPEVRVGVLTPRRPEMIVGILGVLAAGGAYVPLDPAYPAQRIVFTLDDSAVPVLLVCGGLPEALADTPPSATLVDLLDFAPDADVAAGRTVDGDPFATGHADDLGYVIYTSGSTGRPKGVAIRHRSAVTLVRWARTLFGDDELASVLAATSICFDLSVFEMFLPLASGGRIVLVDNALALARLDEGVEVTLVNTVPSAMAELAGHLPATVRTVNLAGEPLPRALAEAIYAQPTVSKLYNLYGPSEDTTYSTWALVPAGEERPPTIGVPIGRSTAYLLDRHGELVAGGVPGELLLGGEGLARGYLGRPSLTAERFVPDPYGATAGERLYRTGDLARWASDGQLEFLGRIDHQVKVRGFRIELGEIQSRLKQHPAIDDAVVVARTADGHEAVGGDLVIAAYLVASGEAPSVGELRRHLEATLPAFMVPQAFVFLDAMPLTPNGKIDRKALPAPEVGSGDESTYEAPSTAVEEMLAEIWHEVLGVERVGIHDSFFDLGGHSLKATQVLSRVEELFGVELSVRALLESPTIAGLAEAIAHKLMEGADEETIAAILAGGE